MRVAVPKEIKTREYRVALTPAGTRALVETGHQVTIQAGAGLGSGIADEDYRRVGARVVSTAPEVFADADLIIKVKEPLPQEWDYLHEGQTLFTFLHLAAEPDLARVLLDRKVTALGYETVERDDRSLPLLHPMSEIAGRMSVQVGAHYLQKGEGGKGVLLAGTPGVRPGRVVILGAGTVGGNAVRIAVGMGADVTVLDVEANRLAALDDHYGNRIHTLVSNAQNIEEEVSRADLLIGAVLLPGDRAPVLVDRDLVSRMEAGSVIVDVAVDQGGCVATIHPTTHDQPVYVVSDVVHYGVANMPGAVSRTSTFALTNNTFPFIEEVARKGTFQAVADNPVLGRGLNTQGGKLRHSAVAKALDLPWEKWAPR